MKMDRYVEQLIEDIRTSVITAEKRLDEISDFQEDEIFHFDVDDNSFHGIILSVLFDIDKMFFPELILLNDSHISVLVNEIEKLWRAYGLNPVFHDALPDSLKYCQFRNYMTHVVYPVKSKIVDVELCDYLPHQCPFGELCPVAESYYDNMKDRHLSA
ncbi:MAG: hypothetical protein GXO47_10260 [Chlorobi bacterium]|nr:hypothetical protein [Chlorobiota bacterium]